jgi:hypothetical protein
MIDAERGVLLDGAYGGITKTLFASLEGKEEEGFEKKKKEGAIGKNRRV